VTFQSRQIEKMEVECSMLYELVLGIYKSYYPLVSHPNVSIGFFHVVVKDEETIHQATWYLEMENVELLHQL